MISNDEIQRAFDWLRDNAEAAGVARGQRIALEEGRKRIKAMIMKEHADKSLGVQEREAYADERYRTHIEGLRAAVEEDERLRWLKDAAIAKIDAWRTMEANKRGMGRVG